MFSATVNKYFFKRFGLLRYAPTDNNFAGCMRNLAVATLSVASQQISFTENAVDSSGVTHDGCIEEVTNTNNSRSHLTF